jgi:peptidoglycan/LPS O-acetylase OafA/YrhL
VRGAEFRIPSLDGIRAAAAMTVFVSHLGLRDVVPGGFGVTVFFFLSGFLITTLLRREYEHTGSISFSRFYLRRIYRIWPPMYLVLLLLMLPIVNGHAVSVTTPPALASQFLQYVNYYVIAHGSDQLIPGSYAMWSLAVEEHFYLLFPLALSLLLRRNDYRRTGVALLCGCALLLAWRCLLVFGFGFGESYTYLATDTRLDSILYGCIMGVWLNPALDGKILEMSPRRWIGVLAIAATVLLFCFIYRNASFRETFRYSLQGLALAPLFFCAIRYPQWPVFAWLNFGWVRGLGTISYTFYLIHTTALDVAERCLGGPRMLVAVSGFLASVAFSAAMYFLVERRMAQIRRRLHA